MVNNNSEEKGFTLVEVIVAAVLMSVLALGAYSLFIMYLDSTHETAANMRMQRQAGALVDEISRNVRNSAFVFAKNDETPSMFTYNGENDDWDNEITAVDADGNDVTTSVRQIFISDSKGGHIVSFEFSDGGSGGIVLMDGEPFVLGGDTVKIDFSNSTFDVRSDRRQVRINMMLRTSANSKEEFTLNIQRGVFRCRN